MFPIARVPIFAFLVVLLLAPAAPAAAQEAPDRDPAAVVDAWVAAYNDLDEDALYRLVVPGVQVLLFELDSLRLQIEGEMAFREQVGQQLRQMAALRPRIQVLERIVSDFLVVQRERTTLSPPRGEPFSWTGTVAYRVRDGRILRRIDLVPMEVVDPSHVPSVPDPAFPGGEGPTVWIDAGHNAMHTAEGTYWAFGEMLRRGGFRVRTWNAPFTDDVPPPGDVLVISNALADRNVRNWSIPTPSAFTSDEIQALEAWVRSGGRLLLIADHMPFPGAAEELAAEFGFEFRNGFAVDTAAGPGASYGPWRGSSTLIFRRNDGSLPPHPIRAGRGPALSVDSVRAPTGQAFRSPEGAAPLLVLPSTAVSLEPDTAWVFSEDTGIVDVGGWHQGATLEWGEGRLVVLGEAGQFRPGGGDALLGHNGRFARNVVEWLAGVLPAQTRGTPR